MSKSRKKKEKVKSKDSDEDISSGEDDSDNARTGPIIPASSGSERRSGRIKQLSKKVKSVDKETRAEISSARLAALESDNYGASKAALEVQADDDEYDDNEDGFAKKKKKRDRGADRAKKSHKYTRNLNKILEEMEDATDLPPVNYFTIAAGPSRKPARQFCSVCGLLSTYNCVRCGMKFCSLRCNETHKDTRCLKFTI